ncbi:MAG: DUF1430 domain-containing protein [Streptococcaceae bacterium]|jgi:putative ABC transport system permease protein|nr:DUF1430 domain-containing protein [Streptococcaceae bacterium]
MYRFFYRLLSILSISAVVIFSVVAIQNFHKQMFADADAGVSVIKAKLDIKQELQEIAVTHQVLIAKQIMEKSIDGKSNNQPTFQTFGSGKLPENFVKQTDKSLIESSPDDVLYFIFGKGLSDQALTNLLNEKGNQVMVYRQNWRLIGLRMILAELNIFLALFLILLALGSLIVAEKISKLKQVGVERLAGMSTWQIAFRGFKNLLLFELFSGIILSALAYFYLVLTHLSAILYAQIIITTVLVWLSLLVVSSVIVMLMMYLALKSQRIQQVIKGYAPIKLLSIIILSVQILSIAALIFSLANVINSGQQIATLKKAESKWQKNPTWFAPSLMGGMYADFDEENLFNFLKAAQKEETVMIVADNLNYSQDDKLFPNKESEENAVYVSPNFLTKEHIDSNLTGSEFGEKNAWILVPKSQESQKSALTQAWKAQLKEGYDKEDIKSAVYDDRQPIFTYRILGFSAANNATFAHSPVLLVLDFGSFENSEKILSYFTSWISQQQIIFSNPKITTKLVEQYKLKENMGSYTNGLYAVQREITKQQQARLYLSIASIIAIATSLILLSILNSIYLYQNRRKIAIQKLAGLSSLTIHWRYLGMIFVVAIVVSIVILLLQLPICLEIVPFLMLTLVLGLFQIQSKKSAYRMLDNLKGE